MEPKNFLCEPKYDKAIEKKRREKREGKKRIGKERKRKKMNKDKALHNTSAVGFFYFS